MIEEQIPCSSEGKCFRISQVEISLSVTFTFKVKTAFEATSHTSVCHTGKMHA